MEIYDKAAWHIDNGENDNMVVEKFRIIFDYLKIRGFLAEEGLEIYDLGIDASVSLHERMVNKKGKEFLKKNYDRLINLSSEEIMKELKHIN